MRASNGCGENCSGCWQEHHEGHEMSWRHEDFALYSATCHDCNETWSQDPHHARVHGAQHFSTPSEET